MTLLGSGNFGYAAAPRPNKIVQLGRDSLEASLVISRTLSHSEVSQVGNVALVFPLYCSSSSAPIMGDDGEKVQLYVYDLSNGLARQLSPMLLNKQVCACSYSM